MSANLPSINLTGAVVGQQFTMDFNQFVKFNPMAARQNPLSQDNKAHIALFNESGCGLSYVINASGHGEFLPAGAWVTTDLEPDDSNIEFTVTYTLPNPPVSQLNGVYYTPGELRPPSYALGNSPIGIGGSVQTSSVQTLSQEGQASGLLTIDIGDTGFSQLIAIFNDGHGIWAIDQSGTKHQVAKFNLAGNPLQLGQANDTSEVLGNILLDQIIFLKYPSNQAIVTGNTITIPGTMIQVSVANASTTGIIMTAGSSAGQLVYLYNLGPNSLTFAASGSNVRQGSNIVLGNGKLLTMIWDGANWATNGPIT